MKNQYTRPTEGVIKLKNGKGITHGKDRKKSKKRKKGRK